MRISVFLLFVGLATVICAPAEQGYETLARSLANDIQGRAQSAMDKITNVASRIAGQPGLGPITRAIQEKAKVLSEQIQSDVTRIAARALEGALPLQQQVRATLNEVNDAANQLQEKLLTPDGRDLVKSLMKAFVNDEN